MKLHLLPLAFLLSTSIHSQVFHRTIDAPPFEIREEIHCSAVTGDMTMAHISGHPYTGFYYYITDTSFNLLNAGEIIPPAGTVIVESTSICAAQSNSFLACFQIASAPNGYPGTLLLQIRNDGSFGWSKIYGDSLIKVSAVSVSPSSDGYMLCAHLNTPAAAQSHMFARIDTYGNMLWARSAGSGGMNACVITEARDAERGFICGSRTDSSFLLMRIDTTGTLFWSYKYTDGLPGSAVYDGMYARDSVIYASSKAGISVHAYSIDGEPLWAAKYNHPASNQFFRLADMDTTADGILLTAVDSPQQGSSIAAGCKISYEGDLQWSRAYHSPASQFSRVNAAVVLPGGAYLVSGTTGTNFDIPYCAKASPLGYTGCGDADVQLVKTPLTLTQSPGPAISALFVPAAFTTVQRAAIPDTLISYCFSTAVGLQEQRPEVNRPAAYFSGGSINLSLPQSSSAWQVVLFNLNGAAIRSLESKEQSEQIGTSGLAVGIYLLRMSNGTQVISQKILITQ
jgi:hypothetical protein